MVCSFLVVVGVDDGMSESGGYDGKEVLLLMDSQHPNNG